jgi:uracil-DNA glycosylase
MLVPGRGDLWARVVVAGEGPGATEDRTGEPFVGPAGQLLTGFLAEAGLLREDCWITNVVKYRCTDSRGNDRRPSFEEARAGARYLKRELEIIHPLLVILCGRVPYQAVRPGASIVQDRGRSFTTTVPNRIYLPVLHPSACLQGPSEWMAATRQDFRGIGKLGLTLTEA